MLHNERQQRYKRVQRSLAAAIGFSFCLLVNKTPWCKQVFTSCVCKQNSVDGAIAKTCDSCVSAMGGMRDKGNVGKWTRFCLSQCTLDMRLMYTGRIRKWRYTCILFQGHSACRLWGCNESGGGMGRNGVVTSMNGGVNFVQLTEFPTQLYASRLFWLQLLNTRPIYYSAMLVEKKNTLESTITYKCQTFKETGLQLLTPIFFFSEQAVIDCGNPWKLELMGHASVVDRENYVRAV